MPTRKAESGSERAGRHEWACFAAQPAAEKAINALLHLSLGQETSGRVINRLLKELPIECPPELIDRG